MSDLDVATPRVFLAPHGLTGLSLTSAGLAQVPGTAAQLVGPKKLIDPARVARVWVRPRRRAQQTFEILFGDDKAVSEKTVTTEDIAEWHYGDYEGLWTAEIKASRAERGLDKERAWDVCRDGCEGGESADQVSARLDKLISEIRNVQRPGFNGEGPCDVVLAAHGHILRAFAKRWIRCPLETPLPMMTSPGTIAVLSCKNRNIHEPGFYMGMSLPPQK